MKRPCMAPSTIESHTASMRWWPMMFSLLGLLIPNGFALRGDVTPLEWGFAALGALAFVTLCAVAVISWQLHRPFVWVLPLLVALGVGYSAMVFEGVIFFGLAAHVLPWAVSGRRWPTVAWGLGLIALVASSFWIMPEHSLRWVSVALYLALAIVGQMWVVRMCVNLRRLAEMAERERIANDLHDLLGEALSKIALKAERATVLLEEQRDGQRDGQCADKRAGDEVAAAERICRNALADVRQTILSYRTEPQATKGRIDAAA